MSDEHVDNHPVGEQHVPPETVERIIDLDRGEVLGLLRDVQEVSLARASKAPKGKELGLDTPT